MSAMEEESSKWMIEQAKEELQILEAQHPNRFGFLKMELRNFINGETNTSSPLYFHNSFVSFRKDSIPSTPNSSATTQASSNGKRRKFSEIEKPEDNPQSTKRILRRSNHSMEKLDAAIERAKECLRKIQEIKRSFANP
ncbi:uncharacterized protein LOC122077544 [Macadamia integrifolia]|uniref:uncharacterized protein LOC122077544 n=1 Tax=Macadamia integrifolia TaxID=60698 RepID=UPI001C4EC733|nr:uncharacterized protein LOC122077544 [Macadamia integrifolia]